MDFSYFDVLLRGNFARSLLNSGGVMLRLILMISFIMAFMAPVSAQDPGQPDSLIIELVSAEPGVPSVMLPIYVVTDNPVTEIVLPIEWDSPDDQINASGVYYFEPLLSWDQMEDNIDMTNSHILISGVSDTGGDPNPVLHTNYQRQLVMFIRMVIHPQAEEQFVPVSAYEDAIHGSTKFTLEDGSTVYEPVTISGGLLYQAVGIEDAPVIPSEISLNQNYPNPFNMNTEINFAIPSRSYVTLEIYNILGRKIKTLLSGYLDTGRYSAKWDGTDERGNKVSSGMYFYSLKSEDTKLSRKMLLLK